MMFSVKSITCAGLIGVMATSAYASPPSHSSAAVHQITPVNVTVKSRERIAVPRHATITFTLWGVDAMLADHPATRLATYRYSLNALPTHYRLPLDRALTRRIQPQSNRGTYQYYLTADVHAGHGRKFAVTDYGKSGPVFARHYAGLKQTIVLKRTH